jgi:hypothetical protein
VENFLGMGRYRRNLAAGKTVTQTDTCTPISPTVGVHERILTLQVEQYAKHAIDYWTGESLRREVREMRKYRR